MEAKQRIIVALDVYGVLPAIRLAEQLKPYVGYFKIGLQFINSMLASLILPRFDGDAEAYLQDVRKLFRLLEGRIFWDGKFNDTPDTVSRATLPIARMGVQMFSIHASAGRESVVRAVTNKGNSLVLGATVLTSISEAECVSIFGDKPGPKVLQFAKMLVEVEADGIICSAQEIELLGQRPEMARLLKVTPSIRPLWAAVYNDDQKRTMMPGEAVKAGARYLVIGRPLTQPPAEIGGPVEAAKRIAEEIAEAILQTQIAEDFS